MKNFIKNYLLLVLMGLGFLTVIVLMSAVGVSKNAPQTPQADQVVAENVVAPSDQQPVSADNNLEPTNTAAAGFTPLSIEKMDGTTVRFEVELATEPEQWAKGLMHRSELAEDKGMLFIFKDNAERSFWMKNVVIPLDMIFIDQDGIIHNIILSATPGDESHKRSNGPVPYVLEIAGGRSEALGIEVGDKVIHADIVQ